MKKIVYFLIIFAMLIITSPAMSDTLVLNYDTVIEGSSFTGDGVSTIWLTATFVDMDNGTTDTSDDYVQLTLAAVGLLPVIDSDLQYVSAVYLNLDPLLDPTMLDITPVNISAVGDVDIDTGVDDFQADGDGKYDIYFEFPPAMGAVPDSVPLFTDGEVITFNITYDGGSIDVYDFYFLSAVGGGNDIYWAAAQITDASAQKSTNPIGWIAVGPGVPVPEPATLLLLGSGLIGVVVFRRKFKK